MRQKQFTKKQVKAKIRKVLTEWKNKKLDGKRLSLKSVLGDYTYNSMNRHIKEVLFYNLESNTRNGAIWYLRYPKKRAKKLAKKVMKAIYVTS